MGKDKKTKKDVGSKKTRKAFSGLFKLLNESQGKTVPKAKLLEMGLPYECKGGRIISDKPLPDKGCRIVEYEVGGDRFSVGYEVGPQPFGRPEQVDITLLGTYN